MTEKHNFYQHRWCSVFKIKQARIETMKAAKIKELSIESIVFSTLAACLPSWMIVMPILNKGFEYHLTFRECYFLTFFLVLPVILVICYRREIAREKHYAFINRAEPAMTQAPKATLSPQSQPQQEAEKFQRQQFINAMERVQMKFKQELQPPRRQRRAEKRQTDAQLRRQKNNMWKKAYEAESELPPLNRDYFNDKGEPVDFYRSRQWRSLRAKALHLWGDAPCACCNEPFRGRVKHVDHIKPRSKHPNLELELSNLQVMCEDCNLGKSNNFEVDWRTPEQRKAFGV